MLSLGELSLFINEEVYLIKNDITVAMAPKEDLSLSIEEPETEEEEITETPAVEVHSKFPIKYPPVLFVIDKQLKGIAEETFRNLVTKGLLLDEKDFSLITQEQVLFSKPEEVTSKKIVLLGVPFSGLQTKYKVISTEKQLILLADSMDRISENVDLKRQLWAALQLMFPKK